MENTAVPALRSTSTTAKAASLKLRKISDSKHSRLLLHSTLRIGATEGATGGDVRKNNADIDATIAIKCCLESILRMVGEGHSFQTAFDYHMDESDAILVLAKLVDPKTKEFYE